MAALCESGSRAVVDLATDPGRSEVSPVVSSNDDVTITRDVARLV